MIKRGGESNRSKKWNLPNSFSTANLSNNLSTHENATQSCDAKGNIVFFSENGKNDKEHWTFYVVKSHLKLNSIIDIGFISSRWTSVCFILVLRPSLCTSKSESDQTWKATTPFKNGKKENMTTLCWKLFRTAGKKCKWAI